HRSRLRRGTDHGADAGDPARPPVRPAGRSHRPHGDRGATRALADRRRRPGARGRGRRPEVRQHRPSRLLQLLSRQEPGCVWRRGRRHRQRPPAARPDPAAPGSWADHEVRAHRDRVCRAHRRAPGGDPRGEAPPPGVLDGASAGPRPPVRRAPGRGGRHHADRAGRRPPRVPPLRPAVRSPGRPAGPPDGERDRGGDPLPDPPASPAGLREPWLRPALAAADRARGGRGPLAADVSGAERGSAGTDRRRRPRLPAVTVRVAQVGLGYWGPNLARAVAAVDGAELAVLCDADPERLKRLGRQYPAARLSSDYADVLADATIDAIILATPVETHFKLARAALEAGKHILVEKPLATTSADCEALIALADERNLRLMVGHVFVYNAAVNKVKEYIDSGEIGDVYYVYSQRLNLGQVRQDVNAMWNFAPHDISILCHWFGGE